MKDGFSVLQPFGVARDRDLNCEEECLISKSDIYTYVSDIYTMHTNIGLSHVCMSNQELPFSLVDHVVCHALVHMTNNLEMDGVQVLASSDNPCTVDIFLTMICFTMHSYNLGYFMYLNDILGEDFRSRFLNDGKVNLVARRDVVCFCHSTFPADCWSFFYSHGRPLRKQRFQPSTSFLSQCIYACIHCRGIVLIYLDVHQKC